MAFAIKAEVRDTRAKAFAFVAQKTMYGGKQVPGISRQAVPDSIQHSGVFSDGHRQRRPRLLGCYGRLFLTPYHRMGITIGPMRIGELAARAGVNVQTILFYERRRLLPRPPRTPGGYRSYGEADLAQVQFIRRIQRLGFTLKEIEALLPHHGSPQNPERLAGRTASDELALFQMVTERLSRIDAQIAALQQVRDALRAAVDERQSRLTACPARDAGALTTRFISAPPRRKKNA